MNNILTSYMSLNIHHELLFMPGLIIQQGPRPSLWEPLVYAVANKVGILHCSSNVLHKEVIIIIRVSIYVVQQLSNVSYKSDNWCNHTLLL